MFKRINKSDSPVRVVVIGEHKDGILKMAVARCSTKDTFTKAKGTDIAKRRLELNRTYQNIDIKECDANTFNRYADEIIKQVEKTGKVYHPKVEAKIVAIKLKQKLESTSAKIQKLTDQYNNLMKQYDDCVECEKPLKQSILRFANPEE